MTKKEEPVLKKWELATTIIFSPFYGRYIPQQGRILNYDENYRKYNFLPYGESTPHYVDVNKTFRDFQKASELADKLNFEQLKK